MIASTPGRLCHTACTYLIKLGSDSDYPEVLPYQMPAAVVHNLKLPKYLGT